MLDHRLESLEARSLLSSTLPADLRAGDGADAAVVEAAWADADMYSFRRGGGGEGGGDEPVFEEAAAWEDGGTDRYEWDGGAFDDAASTDLTDDTSDDESHAWVGFGDAAGDTAAADEPAAEDEGDDMAEAVSFAHEDEIGTGWIDDGDEGDEVADSDQVADLPGAEVRFSFEDGSSVPSYRDLLL